MKNIIILLFLLTSCCPKYDKNFKVTKNNNNYKMWVSYYGVNKDSIHINWLISYNVKNNTSRGVKFDWVRKRPEYLRQYVEENRSDSLILFDRLINNHSNRELIINCSKKVHFKQIPSYILNNRKAMFSLGEFKKNITKIPNEQIEFRQSIFFQNILKEIEQDSIAIVFRDSVADDYFQFKGIIKDKELKFSR